MKTIKLRAYAYGKMWEVIYLNFIDKVCRINCLEARLNNKVTFLLDEIKLFEYIGIKDRYKNEIYEGDILEILKLDYEEEPILIRGYIEKKGSRYVLITNHKTKSFIGIEDFLSERIVIVGNICQNSGLLTRLGNRVVLTDKRLELLLENKENKSKYTNFLESTKKRSAL